MNLHDRQRIIYCLNLRIPFLAYALPQSRSVAVVSGTDRQAAGIKFSMFGKNAISVCLAESDEKTGCLIQEIKQTDKADYVAAFNEIVAQLKRDGGKTVLSRVIELTADGGIDWSGILDNLFDKADINSFRFIYHTHETGCWLGASPELLLKESADGCISTMALAGTRPAGNALDADAWDDKNLEEHRLVVDYITGCFEDAGLEPVVSEQQTVTHGKLQHLRHIVTATNSGNKFDSLLNTMNPTPALAGWPVDNAIKQISEAEKQPRYCYGGYISLTLSEGTRVAYVNLRSCYCTRNRFYLYCGGGLTAQSELESEWAETELKSTAMRLILDL